MINLDRLFSTPGLSRRVIRYLIRTIGLGGWQFQYKTGSLARPNYAYLVYQAAQLAHRSGEPRVSVIEFGVAGGNGLAALEQYAEQVEKIFHVKIEVYGFDTTEGLPAPVDHRDLPYHWKTGFFHMDLPLLKSRLKRSQLVIGDTRDTTQTFIQQFNPAPIGAISFDLDFHSSTVAALKILESQSEYLLPRMFVYFDDVIGRETELYNDYTGARLAIHEFNRDHESRKLSPLYYLRAMDPITWWHHHMWSFHAFDHPKYGQFVSEENQQIPLQ
ncbi:MAG: hypothetical protein WAL75_00305 [Terracidiphilus sp.]